MAIEVTVNTMNTTEITYPRVCRHREYRDLIVLFTSQSEGVCISPENHPSYGEHNEDWDITTEMWIPTCVTINSTQGA